MPALSRQTLCDFVNSEIVKFHQARLAGLSRLKLDTVLKKKNPYLA